MSKARLLNLVRGHKGATVIFVAVAMVMLLSFAALAVDVGYLYMVRAELQSAADSGALAGAQVLYNSTGTAVNEFADDMAQDYVEKNYSENAIVQVLPDDGVNKGIQIGHWSFNTRTFTPFNGPPYPDPPVLWNVTPDELDADTRFINAVRVITIRKRDPITNEVPLSFFARVFGALNTDVKSSAVGYIGFAGQLEPGAVDFPIAICRKAILKDDEKTYSCGVGRMINSAAGNPTHETGGWTNYEQPCVTANPTTVKPILDRPGGCGSAQNEEVILLGGEGVGTTGGMVDTVFDRVVNCWTGWKENRPYDPTELPPPTSPWKIKLPVVDCEKGNMGICSPVAGAVEVDVVWISYKNDPNYVDVPRTMSYPNSDGPPWSCSITPTNRDEGIKCWDEFVKAFELHYTPGQYATYQEKTLYFLPDCTPHELTGLTGGENFGILAKIPVLVK